ncbi:MAG TPA: hypothetical protein VGK67_33120 [Myxococcales bacterium]|jgi:hypothetical protein
MNSTPISVLFLAGALLVAGCSKSERPPSGRVAAAPQAPNPGKLAPDDVPRLAPDEVRSRVQAGQTLLVCAYDDDAKYQSLKLDGSISIRELERRAPSLGKDQAIVFYCA